MSFIRIERIKDTYGSLAKYNVLIDDVSAGKISNGGTLELSTNEGSHTLRIRSGSNASNVIQFNVAENETLSFRIGFSKAGHLANSSPIILISFALAFKNFVGISAGFLIVFIVLGILAFIYANMHKEDYFYLESLEPALVPIDSSADNTADQEFN